MNKDFDYIFADENLKAETLKKAKEKRIIKWKTVSVIAATLVVMIGVSVIFGSGAFSNGKNYAPDAESGGFENHYYSNSVTTDIFVNSTEEYDKEAIKDDSETVKDTVKEEHEKPVPDAPSAPEATGVPEATSKPDAVKPDKGSTADSQKTPENLSINLTAARIDDNKNFDSWLKNLQSYNTFKNYDSLGIGATKKITVTVLDNSDKPVKNAQVTLLAGKTEISKAVTNNKGIAYVYYNWFYKAEVYTPDKIKVESKGKTAEENLGSKSQITVKDDFEKTYLNELDIMFMIDTTGSMKDELSYLKYQTNSMLQSLPTQLDTKISINFYRDKGDEYLIKSNPFTGSLTEVSSWFDQTDAQGGGDTPEAVDAALKCAMEEHTWRENSVKIMFLVLDASAHEEEEVKTQLYTSISEAAKMGIRIVPVMASGADEVCEIMCRQMALLTGGQFVFLTDDSGIGSSHREPVTDVEYDVKPLITVLKEIINEYTV